MDRPEMVSNDRISGNGKTLDAVKPGLFRLPWKISTPPLR